MKTLTLSLKRKWFDMIKAGIKKEEYMECSEFWIRRFVKDFKTMSDFRFEMCFRGGKFLTDYLVSDVQDCLNCLDFDRIVFTLGYPMRTPWRGFKEDTWTTAYGKIADYMAENADKIKKEANNG